MRQSGFIVSFVCLVASILVVAYAAVSLYYTVCREVMAIISMDTSGHLTVANCTSRCDSLFTMALDDEEKLIDDYCSRICYQAIAHGMRQCHH